MIMGTKIKLRAKRLADALADYSWSRDPELIRLDAAALSPTSFSQYLSDYANELRYPFSSRYRFAVETLDGKHIGNCSYYNIIPGKAEAELGILVGNRDYWDKGYGADVVSTLASYIFRQTNFKRIYLKTLDWNTRARKCFKKCGFTPYGYMGRNGFSFVFMGLYRSQWEEQQKEQETK